MADFQKSLAAYPTAEAAERLGDEAKKGDQTDLAIDAYATAFAFRQVGIDPGSFVATLEQKVREALRKG